MKASFLIKRINGFLSAQGKALPRVAEDILRKSPFELTERENQWYRENILPNESFFVEVLKTIYSEERKPKKWLQSLGGGGPLSIVEEMAAKALRELGVLIGVQDVGGHVPLASPAVPPAGVAPHLEAGASSPETSSAASPASTTSTAPPTVIVPPAPQASPNVPEAGPGDSGEKGPVAEEETPGVEEVSLKGAVGPGEVSQLVSASPPTVIVPPAPQASPNVPEAGPGDSEVASVGLEGEEMKGTFHLRSGEADEEEEGTKGTPTVYLPASPPLIDYRQAWPQTAESPFSPTVVDQRYELERGPGVPLYREVEATLPEMFAPEAVPREKRGFKGWLSAHKVLVSSVAAALVVVGVGLFLLFFFFLGGEKVVDEWSVSQSLGKNIRVERQACLKKNAGGSPYLYVVTLKLENTGSEEIKKIHVEEEVPQLLWTRGGIRYNPDPDRSSEDAKRVGWTGEHLFAGDVYQVEYTLPLQAELSAPQLEEIKDHFSRNAIACVYLPENFDVCSACNGQGSTTCQACSGMGSVTCPTCHGVGYITCSVCRGQGKVTCPECDGYGYYYYGWWGPYVCSYCGGTGKVTCSNCRGTGRVTCPTCRGAMRITCASCGGTGKITCSTCGGDGLVPIEYGERVLYKEGS